MTRFGSVVCAFVALLIVSVGCSSGGGNDVVIGPPADVSGEWSTVANNAGSAILTGCTGDLVSLNGLTVAGIASTANCVYSGPIVTTQSGPDYTHVARTYSCDDSDYGSDAGGGSITEQHLTGQLDSFSTYYGTSGSEFVTGTVVTPNTIALLENRITVSGSTNGSCNISPNLSMTATIYQALQGANAAPHRSPGTFSLARMLVAYRSKPR